MGTEIAVPLFGPLILIGVALLVYVAFSRRKVPVTQSSIFGLGWSRVASGYLFALLTLLVYSYLDTADISRQKIARGDVTTAEASQYFLGWFVNIFCLITPFMFVLMTALGLPLLSALRRVRFASVLGAMLVSQLIAISFTWVSLAPYTEWCRAHEVVCFKYANKSNAVLAGLLTAGFVLGARLPWLFSPTLLANYRLERMRKPRSTDEGKGR